MKRFLTLVSFAALAVPAFAQISGSIGGMIKPGLYGQINIGPLPPVAVVQPQPVVIAPAPVLVQPSPVVVAPAPIYLYVPPAHQHNWRHYCARYHACDRPVLFVREDYVREQYGREHPDWDRHDHDHDHDRDHEHDRDHDHGHGGDHDHGHGRDE